MTGHPDDTTGASYLELLLVVALIGALTGLAAPMTAHAIDAGRARHAAGFIASRLRLARQQAVFRGASVAVVFDLDRTTQGWTLRVCTDANGNGVRRADIRAGRDGCAEGPYALAEMFPGVAIAVDPSVRGPDGRPATSDPVRFGASDLASFSSEGTSSSGTLYLQSSRGLYYAVRVAGVTGRTRLLRYHLASRTWLAG